MAVQHATFVTLGIRLINANGRDATLVTETNTGSSFNPTIGKTNQTIKVLQTEFKQSERDGGTVKDSDKMFLVHSEIEPNITDKLIDNGPANGTDEPIEYSIKSVKSVHPGETKILYRVHCML